MKKLLIVLMLGIFTYGCAPCGGASADDKVTTVVQFYSGGTLIETKTLTNSETVRINNNCVSITVNDNEKIYYYGDIKIAYKIVRKSKSKNPTY